VARIATNGLWRYSFVHIYEPDDIGHDTGWGSETYSNTIQMVDEQLGRIFEALDANPALADRTALIVTSDHGGHGYGHGDPNDPRDYLLPLYIWGEGIPAGADAYTLFTNRAAPGAVPTDYNTVPQPLRNGDSANLALALLGLPPIPGSTLRPELTALVDEVAAPALESFGLEGDAFRLRFGGVPRTTYRILYCDDLGTADWLPLDGATADESGLVDYLVTPPPDASNRFYRTVYP
jgi:hypothetical protein